MNSDYSIIKKLLQRVGIRVFVKYFYVFSEHSNDDTIENILKTFDKNNEKWTISARKTRAYTGIKIFKLNLQYEAIDYILNVANPNKLDEETIYKARKIKMKQ